MSPKLARRLRTDSTSRSSRSGACKSAPSRSRLRDRSPSAPATEIAVATTDASTTINETRDHFSDRRRHLACGTCPHFVLRPGAGPPPPSASMQPLSPCATGTPVRTCRLRSHGAARSSASFRERSGSGCSSLHAFYMHFPHSRSAPLHLSGPRSPGPTLGRRVPAERTISSDGRLSSIAKCSCPSVHHYKRPDTFQRRPTNS